MGVRYHWQEVSKAEIERKYTDEQWREVRKADLEELLRLGAPEKKRGPQSNAFSTRYFVVPEMYWPHRDGRYDGDMIALRRYRDEGYDRAEAILQAKGQTVANRMDVTVLLVRSAGYVTTVVERYWPCCK